jgi:acyl-CoA synthetase (AMP-forming)/AMP-acid ligase II
MGFRRGDVLAAWLPLLDEHILLEYGCFRLGVIHAPLDPRLQSAELPRCLDLVRAKGLAFPGKVGATDFAAEAEALRRHGEKNLERRARAGRFGGFPGAWEERSQSGQTS